MKKHFALFLCLATIFLSCKQEQSEIIDPTIISFEVVVENQGVPEVFGAQIEGTQIKLELPFGTNFKAIAPNIACNESTSIYPNSGIARNFSSTAVYTVKSGGRSIEYNVTITTAPEHYKTYKVFTFLTTKDVVVGMLDAFASPSDVTCLISENRTAIAWSELPENMIFYANEGVTQDLYTNSSVLKDVVAIAQKDKTARFVFYIPYGNSMEIIAIQVAPLIGCLSCLKRLNRAIFDLHTSPHNTARKLRL